MEKDVDKKTIISHSLSNQLDLHIEFVKAIEGTKISDEELANRVDLDFMTFRYGDLLTFPAIGCALSHCKIYDKIVHEKMKFALVLEDDAIFNIQLVDFIKEIQTYLLVPQPVVVLLTPDFTYNFSTRISLKDNHSLVLVDEGLMTSGYLINNEAAKLLINKQNKLKYLADEWSEFMKAGLLIYGVVPHIISYPDGFGEIGESQLLQLNKRRNNKFRSYLVKLYVCFRSIFKYVKGIRKSSKLW